MQRETRANDHISGTRLTTLNGAGEFLPLLARAVQQFHTYPSASTMCVSAVEACERALRGNGAQEQLTFRVSPRDLLVDEQPFGRGTIVESELARRLHSASIAQVTLDRRASAREITRFCEALLYCGERSHDERTLLELLAERGVEHIVLRPACRPEVLPVAQPPAPLASLARRERERRDSLLAAAGAVNHLYPPEKGWVRVDPSLNLESVSLVELALFAADPADLAHMLMRLTDGDQAVAPADALARRYSDVAMLFAALEPTLSRMMFARLADAVLDLDAELRQALLRRTILPGLLDGKIDGTILRDFPDMDLADSLCLLLDLETAAPEVVPAALARLDLSAEREAAVLPLVEERLRARDGAHPRHTSLDVHARKLLHVEAGRAKSMAEFSAFDLALDGEARATLADIRTAIAGSDTILLRLECIWQLVRLEPNPEVVQRLLARAAALVDALERDGRFGDAADVIARHRALANDVRETRPDVAQALDAAHAAFCVAARAEAIVRRAERGDDGVADASRMVEALGAAIAPALIALARGPRARIVEDLVGRHATLLSPPLAEALDTLTPPLRRVAARAFGTAGAGYELVLSRLLRETDEQTAREALRSLARIGTSRAAGIVAAEIGSATGKLSAAAEQALWQFPRSEVERQVATLLAARKFVLRQPRVAERLLDRAPRKNGRAILGSLEGLRFRFWNPSVARVGRKARAMLATQ